MTLLTLSIKNLRHKMVSYAAYFLSSSFAVWLFFTCTLVLLHPEFGGMWTVTMLLRLLQWIIAGFSVLFILYSHSASMGMRKDKFGVFTQIGMLPGQIARLVHYENGIIGLASVATGIGLGAIYSELLFLVLGRVLDMESPVAAYLSWSAVARTVSVFVVVFGIISVYDQIVLWCMPIADVFEGVVQRSL